VHPLATIRYHNNKEFFYFDDKNSPLHATNIVKHKRHDLMRNQQLLLKGPDRMLRYVPQLICKPCILTIHKYTMNQNNWAIVYPIDQLVGLNGANKDENIL
jgi:hypothetical protein